MIFRARYRRVWGMALLSIALVQLFTGCSGSILEKKVDSLRLEAFVDPSGLLKPEEVHLRLNLLETLEGERPNMGSTLDAVWVRVSGWQGAPRQARVILDNPTLDSIDVLVMDGARILGHHRAGAAYGKQEDLIPTFNLPLNQNHELWFRVRSTKPLVLPFSLTQIDRVESMREKRDLALAT